MSIPAGISGKGRIELAAALSQTARFLTPEIVASALDIDETSAARKLSLWSKSGWVRRVRRGLYISVPVEAQNPSMWSDDALVVATEVWSPCYFSGWTAARYWSLTEQVFRPTVVKTSKRIRTSKIKFLDHDYLVSHVDPKLLEWGLKSEWVDGVRISFSDSTRTVIELLDDPSIGGGIRHTAEILSTYLDDNNPSKLIAYAQRFGNRTVFKRLGYLLEALNKDFPDAISSCHDNISEGFSNLEPGQTENGRRIPRWRLFVNTSVGQEDPS
jgi:predicted transcriptional regulator of viral defense system